MIGFSLTFPALFAKTYRIYRVLTVSKTELRRIVITVYDCLIPIAISLVVMWTILLAWTLTDPLTYSITITEYDEYGNPTASYGKCYSSSLAPFMTVILCLCFGGLIYGNYLCFMSRKDETINKESKYITLAMLNLLQSCILGTPLVILESESPIALFIVKGMVVLACFGGSLFLMFIPKIMKLLEGEGDNDGMLLTSTKNQHNYNSNPSSENINTNSNHNDELLFSESLEETTSNPAFEKSGIVEEEEGKK